MPSRMDLVLIQSSLTMSVSDSYPEIRSYLELMNRESTVRGTGLLCIVAARARVGEGELREIVEDGKPISDVIAAAVASQIEE